MLCDEEKKTTAKGRGQECRRAVVHIRRACDDMGSEYGLCACGDGGRGPRSQSRLMTQVRPKECWLARSRRRGVEGGSKAVRETGLGGRFVGRGRLRQDALSRRAEGEAEGAQRGGLRSAEGGREGRRLPWLVGLSGRETAWLWRANSSWRRTMASDGTWREIKEARDTRKGGRGAEQWRVGCFPSPRAYSRRSYRMGRGRRRVEDRGKEGTAKEGGRKGRRGRRGKRGKERGAGLKQGTKEEGARYNIKKAAGKNDEKQTKKRGRNKNSACERLDKSARMENSRYGEVPGRELDSNGRSFIQDSTTRYEMHIRPWTKEGNAEGAREKGRGANEAGETNVQRLGNC